MKTKIKLKEGFDLYDKFQKRRLITDLKKLTLEKHKAKKRRIAKATKKYNRRKTTKW